MNIIVGCKVVAEEQDILINTDGSLDLSKASPKISQFDLGALQAAVDIKEILGEANIKVLSIGGVSLENTKVRKDILSRGADELNVVIGSKFDGILPCDTAQIFKETAQNLGFDLIICADGSADIFAGQVGARAGTALNIPTINAVNKIVSVSKEKIVVQRELENEVEELEVSLPALICVSADINSPAIPGMKAILAAAKKPTNSLQTSFSATNIVSLKEIKAPKKRDRLGQITQSDSDEGIAEFISNLKKVL